MRASESPATARDRRRRVRIAPSQNGGFAANPPLTARTERETGDVAGAASRMVRALARRTAAGDLLALRCLWDLVQLLDGEMAAGAQAANRQHGYSWSEIGATVGITRQAAWQRWGQQ